VKHENSVALSHAVVNDELVAHQLTRIISSPHFKTAKQMQNFLQYVIRKTLAGKGHELKQYTIAVEALGFPVDFDSDINPVVRIKAGRVRDRLEKYYENEGVNDALVITIPKGSYAPLFEMKVHASDPPVVKDNSPTKPKLAVLCFSDKTQNKESNRMLIQITDTLAKELSHFLFLTLVVSIPHADKSNTRSAVSEISDRFNADYILVFYIQQLPKKQHTLICRLLDSETEEILWSESYKIESDKPFNEQPAIIGNITAVIADIEQGVLHTHWARNLLRDESSIPDSYKPLVYYRYFADDMGRESFEKAVRVCEARLKNYPSDVVSNVLLADYCWRDYIFGYGVIESPLEVGERCAQTAVRLKPDSDEAHYALGQIVCCLKQWQRCLGEFNLARDISQFHAIIEYGVGFHFCMMGRWEEGMELVDKVMSISSSYPSWFNMTPFLNHYFREEYEDALAYALKINAPNIFQGPFARCVAYAQLGEIEKAQKELKTLLSIRPKFLTEGKPMLMRFLASKENADKLWEALLMASE